MSSSSTALSEREQRIRERAYLMWEVAGRPEGAAEEYWLKACALEDEVDAASRDSFPASDPPSDTGIVGIGRGNSAR
jgi:Protein of unknown function (DUF2934)